MHADLTIAAAHSGTLTLTAALLIVLFIALLFDVGTALVVLVVMLLLGIVSR